MLAEPEFVHGFFFRFRQFSWQARFHHENVPPGTLWFRAFRRLN
jgi:hypothetical protein